LERGIRGRLFFDFPVGSGPGGKVPFVSARGVRRLTLGGELVYEVTHR
jgi:hypothetical protein